MQNQEADMKILRYLIIFAPLLLYGSTVSVVESPYNDMKPYIASFNMDSPTFTLAWERGDTTVSCTIYVAIENSDLTSISPLRLTEGNYIDKNPIVTYLDSTHPMIIWERKNNSYFQLYYSYYMGNNTWSYPEQIYSILGDELYPYPYGKKLYFQSIGRIYYTYFSGSSWSSATIVSDINYDSYHPSFSTVTGLVYDVNLDGVWRIHRTDSLFTNTSTAPLYPMVTDYGNYLYTEKNGNIYSLIFYDGTSRHTIDTSNIFIGHHRIVDVGAITKENTGDFECYVKDEENRHVYASNWINGQKYILNSGSYEGDYPSLCVINGYRTLYKVPVIFQEYHDGKWDLYGNIFTLTNGGLEKHNGSPAQNSCIRILYTKHAVEIMTNADGVIYRMDGIPVKRITAGNNEIISGTLNRGVYFLKLKTGQTKKLIIK